MDALEYDQDAIDFYRTDTDKSLDGHVPIKISTLLTNFLRTNTENKLATVNGKRKSEVGLILHESILQLTPHGGLFKGGLFDTNKFQHGAYSRGAYLRVGA
jgi:hypothetical protein